MPTINVKTRFKLLLPGDRIPSVEFLPGVHEVSNELAKHPYLRAHLVDAPAPPLPRPGTPAGYMALQAAASAAVAGAARDMQAARDEELADQAAAKAKPAIRNGDHRHKS